MRAHELRTKNKAELVETLRSLEVRRESLAISIVQRKTKNVRELRAIRRDIARVKTVLHAQSRASLGTAIAKN